MFDIFHLSLAACMFLGAALYSSVGHGGASAYIALMALFSVAPTVMRPTALALNIFVAALGSYRYAHAGYFRWRVVWPFLLGSLPFAFIGGGIQLPGNYYRVIVGVVLILSGLRMFFAAHIYAKREVHDPPIWLSILIGVGLGLLSGLTGTGGGIFLSPIIIFLSWSDLRTTSGIAAMFILGNSIAGLMGNVAIVRSLPAELPLYIVAVVAGGLLGTTFGTKFPIVYVRRALGVVLLVAGVKLIGVY
jgi:uncharacterized membrane protein YfcA